MEIRGVEVTLNPHEARWIVDTTIKSGIASGETDSPLSDVAQRIVDATLQFVRTDSSDNDIQRPQKPEIQVAEIMESDQPIHGLIDLNGLWNTAERITEMPKGHDLSVSNVQEGIRIEMSSIEKLCLFGLADQEHKRAKREAQTPLALLELEEEWDAQDILASLAPIEDPSAYEPGEIIKIEKIIEELEELEELEKMKGYLLDPEVIREHVETKLADARKTQRITSGIIGALLVNRASQN